MEVYDNMIKAMKICAGPDCGPHCPYFGKSDGISKSCRALLLEDAMTALDDQEAANKTIRAERDKLRADNEELRNECNMTVMRCQVLQNEINSLMRKIGKQEDKTDRTSVSDDALKNEYKRGYLDAMEYCFRELCKQAGGGCRHE